jgi:hypothetical protein
MTREHITILIGTLSVGLLFFGYVVVVLAMVRRKRHLSKLKPPETLTVVRGPGETLRRQAERLSDQALELLLFGSAIALFCLFFPLMLVQFWPALHPLPLLGSGLALFGAVSVFVTRRASKLLEERNRKKLGWYGERIVAEVLSRNGIEGAAYFHDVPVVQNGFTINIDHLILTLHAAVVIETKMRSKPTDAGKQRIQVVFDGERLDWPRFKNDTQTLRQVRHSAEWVDQQITEITTRSIQVHSIIAIPGWSVFEKQLGSPRVVSGAGVADAARQVLSTSTDHPPLTSSQYAKLIQHFDQLCRDTEL